MKSPALASLVLTTAVAFGFAPGPAQVTGTTEAEAGPPPPVIVAQTRSRFGNVTHVIDGDSLLIGTREIRLAAIDTPEYSQPYGQEAKQALIDLVQGRKVRVEPVTTDRHGRTVAHVYRDDGLHVNAAMVEAGAAHVYRRYSNDPQLIALEAIARQKKKGLWALPPGQRTSQEQWRREHERENEMIRTGFNCAVRKTRCTQMRSCEEAMFYLDECHRHRLDSDKDGVPCESLCPSK